jgi:hypothetical protein
MELCSQIHAPAASSHCERAPGTPLGRRLGGPQSRSGRGGVEKNFQPLPGLEPPIIQHVVQRYTTELSRLRQNVQLLLRWYFGRMQNRNVAAAWIPFGASWYGNNSYQTVTAEHFKRDTKGNRKRS